MDKLLKHADVVPESVVFRVCQDEVRILTTLLDKSDYSWEDLAKSFVSDSVDVDMNLDI